VSNGLWHTSGKPLTVIEGHNGPVRGVAFNRDSNLLATSGHDGTIRLWNIDDKPLVKLKLVGSSKVAFSKVAFSPNGLIGARGNYSTAYLWDTSGKQLVELKASQYSFGSLIFSPDGKQVAVNSMDDKAILLYSISGKQLALLEGLNLAFSPDGKFLATGRKDGTVQFWDSSGRKLALFQAHQGPVRIVVFSPDSKLLASGGDDSTVRLWDTSGKQLVELKGHKQQSIISTVAFSPDSQLISSCAELITQYLY